ncbi:MAG: hypothetical protein FWE84_02860 [Firmicutes bacterium]|nr:hypothetical protein [Bacillota bacterium]
MNKLTSRTSLNILFVASLLSFFPLSLALVAISMDTELGDFVAKTWVMYFALIIPMFSIICAFIAKSKGIKSRKNIIAGFICSALIVMFGSFAIIMRDFYSYDYSLVHKVEQQIDFKLPDSGKLFTELYGSKSLDGIVEIGMKESKVRFTSESEINDFIDRIKNSDLWTTSITVQNKGLLNFWFQNRQCDYYLIYCIETGKHNASPGYSGQFNFIFLGYTTETRILVIGEYPLAIQV